MEVFRANAKLPAGSDIMQEATSFFRPGKRSGTSKCRAQRKAKAGGDFGATTLGVTLEGVRAAALIFPDAQAP